MDQRLQTGGQRRSGLRGWVLLLFAAYLVGYWASHRHASAWSGRARLIETTAAQEAALGARGLRQVLAESTVVEGGADLLRLREIARRLFAAVPALQQQLAAGRGDAQPAWVQGDAQVLLLLSSRGNAYSLPGGHLVVDRGMLLATADGDALAAILGHVLAHALLRHGGERLTQQKLVPVFTAGGEPVLDGLETRQQRLLQAAIGAAPADGVTLPYSREQEADADRVGLLLAAAACFEPQASAMVWKRMATDRAAAALSDFQTMHPAAARRSERLQGWMDQANQIRAQFCGNR